MVGNLVGPFVGDARTIIRRSGSYGSNGVWSESAETTTTAYGDWLPWEEDDEIPTPRGYRRESMRVLHCFGGSYAPRAVDSVGQLMADQYADPAGSGERYTCLRIVDHQDSTALSMTVDHVRTVWALPSKTTSETGTLL